jgi:hypothetical protein
MKGQLKRRGEASSRSPARSSTRGNAYEMAVHDRLRLRDRAGGVFRYAAGGGAGADRRREGAGAARRADPRQGVHGGGGLPVLDRLPADRRPARGRRVSRHRRRLGPAQRLRQPVHRPHGRDPAHRSERRVRQRPARTRARPLWRDPRRAVVRLPGHRATAGWPHRSGIRLGLSGRGEGRTVRRFRNLVPGREDRQEPRADVRRESTEGQPFRARPRAVVDVHERARSRRRRPAGSTGAADEAHRRHDARRGLRCGGRARRRRGLLCDGNAARRDGTGRTGRVPREGAAAVRRRGRDLRTDERGGARARAGDRQLPVVRPGSFP